MTKFKLQSVVINQIKVLFQEGKPMKGRLIAVDVGE